MPTNILKPNPVLLEGGEGRQNREKIKIAVKK